MVITTADRGECSSQANKGVYNSISLSNKIAPPFSIRSISTTEFRLFALLGMLMTMTCTIFSLNRSLTFPSSDGWCSNLENITFHSTSLPPNVTGSCHSTSPPYPWFSPLYNNNVVITMLLDMEKQVYEELYDNFSINGTDDLLPTSLSTNLPTLPIHLPPIFVLNLDRAPDRWLEAQSELGRFNLSIQRFSAVDGRKLTARELHANVTRLAQAILPKGVVGCFLSHRKFWQHVVDNNLSQAIIMEDDVLLVPNFNERLAVAIHDFNNLQSPNSTDDLDVMLLGAIGKFLLISIPTVC